MRGEDRRLEEKQEGRRNVQVSRRESGREGRKWTEVEQEQGWLGTYEGLGQHQAGRTG